MATHRERHRSERVGWLRAAVLGANDGILSTASLVVGVAASGASHASMLATGVAALTAGALSMAAGEYVSVHSQADTEAADLARERAELSAHPLDELRELTGIYVARGVSPRLAHRVAAQLTQHDALGAHTRDELGLTSTLSSRPIQAALASAASFATGAVLPLLVMVMAPHGTQIGWLVGTSSLCFLAGLGALAARAGGSSVVQGAWRVGCWGVLAMTATAAIGRGFVTVA